MFRLSQTLTLRKEANESRILAKILPHNAYAIYSIVGVVYGTMHKDDVNFKEVVFISTNRNTSVLTVYQFELTIPSSV